MGLSRSGDEGSRTPDLFNAIEALYQLSYIPAMLTNLGHGRTVSTALASIEAASAIEVRFVRQGAFLVEHSQFFS
jgi:hypothetical protein